MRCGWQAAPKIHRSRQGAGGARWQAALKIHRSRQGAGGARWQAALKIHRSRQGAMRCALAGCAENPPLASRTFACVVFSVLGAEKTPGAWGRREARRFSHAYR
jgi:hypothetical protein